MITTTIISGLIIFCIGLSVKIAQLLHLLKLSNRENEDIRKKEFESEYNLKKTSDLSDQNESTEDEELLQEKDKDNKKHDLFVWKQIFNYNATAMCVIFNDKSINMVNESFSNMVGLQKNEIIGKPCEHIMGSPLCSTENCPLSLGFWPGKAADCENILKKSFNLTIARFDGKLVKCVLSVAPLRGQDGDIIGVIKSFQDATPNYINNG